MSFGRNISEDKSKWKNLNKIALMVEDTKKMERGMVLLQVSVSHIISLLVFFSLENWLQINFLFINNIKTCKYNDVEIQKVIFNTMLKMCCLRDRIENSHIIFESYLK